MIMILKSFGAHVPHYAAPVITFIVVGFFLFQSLKAAQEKS